MEKLDLNKLKQEIDGRKQEQTQKNQKLGVEDNTPKKDSKQFLKELVNAHKSMSENKATQHIKQVANRSENISNDPISKYVDSPKPKSTNNSGNSSSMYDIPGNIPDNTSGSQQTQPNSNQGQPLNENVDGDRENQLYNEMQARIKEYEDRYGLKMSSNGNPSPPQQNQQQYNPNIGQNNNDFDSSVISVLEKYFANNMNNVIRDVVVDILMNDKVKDGIINNKEQIKEIVIEVLRELKKKKR